MDTSVFGLHARLKCFPPAQLLYIIYRRLREQGLHSTWLWLADKITRRTRGFSAPATSRVLPQLYVGGQHSRRGLAQMQELGIQAVVNLREESDDAQRGAAPEHYLWLAIPDDHAPPPEALLRGAAFVAAQIAAGRGVYIHCAAGVGRAPTLAAAYLISTGLTAEAAWQTIRQARPFIRPTPPQIEAIRCFAVADTVSVPPPAETPAENFANLAYSLPTGGTMQVRAQLADERISGDPGITGDLLDAQAEILLTWAREEIWRLVNATQGLDDEAAWVILDPQISLLRKHLRRIAQTSGAAEDPAATLRELLQPPLYPSETA